MGTGDLEFIPFARHSFVLCMMKCKESPEKKKKNLDGSSNTDVLKMKACFSIKCLNKVFSY